MLMAPNVFIHKEPVKLPEITQVNKSGGRHYEHGNQRYHSVTRVVGLIGREGIERWKRIVGEKKAKEISESSMHVGTAFHLMIESYLKNEGKRTIKGDFEKQPGELFDTIQPFLNMINNISAQETKLFSKEMGLAGTVDCIAEYDGVPSIIDFKNSRKKKRLEYIEKYFVQTTAYSLMWEELTGEKIEKLVIIVGCWTGESQVFTAKRGDYIEKLWKVIVQYEKENF